MHVIKFGGSSLADGPQLQKVINIIKADQRRQVVVVSAPGKRNQSDTKVTDLLKTYADQTITGQDTTTIQQRLTDRYQAIADYFNLANAPIMQAIREQIIRLAQVHYPSFDHLIAAFMGHGELLNAQLIAASMQAQGLPAQFISPAELGFVVTGSPRRAQLQNDSYTNLQHFKRPTDKILIVPGFIAYTNDNLLVTFSRGGSDITGAILARGFAADLYENFTDVSAIYAVDPHIIPNPAAITTMTYREMRELAYAGFSVFHDEAIIPVITANIPINVKNTNAPAHPGTMIVPIDQVTPTTPITGIASDTRFAALYVHRYLLNKEVGFTLRILQILANHGISYEHMPSGIDDMTIIFDKSQLSPTLRNVICQEIQAELQPDQLTWIDDFAIIMLVGEGMQQHMGVFAEVAHALATHDINLTMINQGASQISVMIGVQTEQVADAVRVIYQTVF